jgi:type IV pilus assembly protein PilV
MMKHNQMSPTPPCQTRASQQGMALLEAMIAIVLFSIGVIGLMGLQANMIKNNTDAKLRSEASFFAQQTLGTMWGNPNNLANYVVTNDPISGLPNGKQTVILTPGATGSSQVKVTITWQQPGQDPHSLTVNAQIGGG